MPPSARLNENQRILLHAPSANGTAHCTKVWRTGVSRRARGFAVLGVNLGSGVTALPAGVGCASGWRRPCPELSSRPACHAADRAAWRDGCGAAKARSMALDWTVCSPTLVATTHIPSSRNEFTRSNPQQCRNRESRYALRDIQAFWSTRLWKLADRVPRGCRVIAPRRCARQLAALVTSLQAEQNSKIVKKYFSKSVND
jgi:hypothetical protein